MVSGSTGCVKRLTSEPTKKVTLEPIKTYHVKAIFVRRHTKRMVTSPANIPASAPLALERRLSVPRKKRPSKLPKGSEATVRPASRSGPQVIKPKPIRIRPQKNVMRRERRRKPRSFVGLLRRAEKSKTLLAAREFSEPLALDMATAMMEASNSPARPVGISRRRKSGRMRSVRSPGESRGVCWAKT